MSGSTPKHTAADLDDAMVRAGTNGLTFDELREQLPRWSRSRLHHMLRQAREAGRVVAESQHPIVFYFSRAVSEAMRRAAFARRVQAERQRRGYAVRNGFAKHLASQGRSLKAAPPPDSTRAQPTVRAVDPNGLKPAATVTWPDTVKTEVGRAYRSLPERLAAECKPEPLPPEPASSWVQAVLQARTHQTEDR